MSTAASPIAYFITWTTYGTWLPGDARGWRKWQRGQQQPRPLLEAWCRDRMKGSPVTLNPPQRDKVELAISEHAQFRGWVLHAVSVRSNHVHVAVTASHAPERVRDQLKARATRVLREGPEAIQQDRVWTRGGDAEFIDDEAGLDRRR
jgi:hypothetical protein